MRRGSSTISLYQLRGEIEMIIMQEYRFLKNEVGEKRMEQNA